MRAHEFDHILGAAANATGHIEFVVIGSQAILGSVDEPPEGLLQSMKADLYPLGKPEDADKIDGALGDGSQFQVTFGYYAHGVGPETAKAPAATTTCSRCTATKWKAAGSAQGSRRP